MMKNQIYKFCKLLLLFWLFALKIFLYLMDKFKSNVYKIFEKLLIFKKNLFILSGHVLY